MGYNIQQEKKASTIMESVPEGRYNVTIDDATVTTTSTNKEMIKLTLSITDGKFAKRKLWHNLILEGKSFRFVIDVLKAYDSALLLRTDEVEADEIAKDMIGKQVSVYTMPKLTNQGNPANDVSQFRPTGAGEEVKGSAIGKSQAAPKTGGASSVFV
jgi:hypothetical protein